MSDPRDFESSALVCEVRQLLKRGALHEAEVRVSERLDRFPESADAWYLRGVIANRREDHATAVRALRKAIDIRPDAALAWLALGAAFAHSNALPDAADAYRAAIERAPAWADGHFNLGVVLKRQGDRPGALRALHAAWLRDPMFFNAARQCVATIAECVRLGELPATPAAATHELSIRPSFTVVLCSIDSVKQARAMALYRHLFGSFPHDIVVIRNPRSLAEAYNGAARESRADFILMSHDDVDVLTSDFAPQLAALLTRFDAVGVVGSTRMDGPAIGWSGHPHLRGWITHRAPHEATWRADVLDPRPIAEGIALLDGVVLASRREVLRAAPFDAKTFDGFHLYDLDWSYRVGRAGFRLGVTGELLLVHASRGDYGSEWERHAKRFCAKHAVAGMPPAPSSFFGATFESAGQVREFFGVLRQLWERS